mgnify:CR=1 FL=1
MRKFRLSKSLDAQLKEQGFILEIVGEGLEGTLERIRKIKEYFPKNDETELEVYIAPFHVVGLPEKEYSSSGFGDAKPGEDYNLYALYVRTKDRR